jgi:peptidoglycan/xylan/chitin deacetylase (PgdA/CDA1 family)
LGHLPVHPDSRPGFLTAELARWAEERRRSLLERGGQLELTDLLTGQMSVGRDVFLRLGGFDADFTRDGRFGGEDYDLGLRLASAGYEIAFNPEAISWQRYVVSPRYYLRQWRGFGRARVMLARKHPETAAVLLSRRERWTDRVLWRWFRWPLRQLVLLLLRVAPTRPRPYAWFYRVQDLQCFSGIRAAGGVPRPRPVRILCYHSISDLKGAGEWEPYGVQARRFRRQIAFLARCFRFIDSQEFRRWLEGAGVPRRAVLVTFDDGLQDLQDAALPTLRKSHVPALAFAVTGLLGRSNEWRTPGDAVLPLLDADALRALTQAEVTIGAHSRTHPMLSRLTQDEISDEIDGSIADLEALSFERPAFLAYPYGAYDVETKRVAAAAGLAGAFTTKPELARPGCDPYEIPRIEILRGDRGLRFVWKVITAGRVRK